MFLRLKPTKLMFVLRWQHDTLEGKKQQNRHFHVCVWRGEGRVSRVREVLYNNKILFKKSLAYTNSATCCGPTKLMFLSAGSVNSIMVAFHEINYIAVHTIPSVYIHP